MDIIRSQIFLKYTGILFGMSTTSGGVSGGKFGLNLSFHVDDDPINVRENRSRYFSALGITENEIAFTRQQHTTNIVSVHHSGINEDCDALITDTKGLFLSISVADCTPVMLYDPERQIISGIHAGWRGTAGRIVEKTMEKMKCDYGCDPKNVVAFIGPSAGKCCYVVGEEVANRFPGDCVVPTIDGKYFLDVKQANAMQLLECGIQNSNIEVNQDCTIHNERYHSFRRDGKNSGRMLAVFGMKL